MGIVLGPPVGSLLGSLLGPVLGVCASGVNNGSSDGLSSVSDSGVMVHTKVGLTGVMLVVKAIAG